MSNPKSKQRGNETPPEINFSKGARGLHHIPPGSRVFLPAFIGRSVWEYFAGEAEQRGVNLSELLTDVLRRDIEINEALKQTPPALSCAPIHNAGTIKVPFRRLAQTLSLQFEAAPSVPMAATDWDCPTGR